jgi:hypothetical protein
MKLDPLSDLIANALPWKLNNERGTLNIYRKLLKFEMQVKFVRNVNNAVNRQAQYSFIFNTENKFLL